MDQTLLQLPPLSLYIHVPWCVKKCPYCDFNSHAAPNKLPEQAYVDALIRDLTTDLPWAQNRKLRSIFFGGGTPSLFSANAIAQLLQTAEKLIGFDPDIEITLEANPGTFEQERFSSYRQAGINRLSIGIQSFNNVQLQALGRIHSAADAAAAVNTAKLAGFDNFNLDLMHGLPNQTSSQALSDLQQAITLSPGHISWYQLTIEPNTIFYNKPPRLPEESTLDDIQVRGQALLEEHGFQQYEVSAYAKPGKTSAHNNNYWRFGDYLGIGAGAHGKITMAADNRLFRYQKTRKPDDYLNTLHFHKNINAIEKTALPLEFLMNALRLKQGVDPTLFEQRTGLPVNTISHAWHQLEQQGLVVPFNQKLATTQLGYQFLNTVLGNF